MLESKQEAPGKIARIPAIDAARGVALVGMFVFHLTWDLADFRLLPPGAPFSPVMMGFGHAVAISFLALAGASLVLANAAHVNWRSFGRRLAIIAAAALAVTTATALAFPDEFIFFGILHCIAVASVLALPFLRAPAGLTLAAAALVAMAPFAFAATMPDTFIGWSLGLSAHPPRTLDWRPVFPWAGATLAGVGLMRIALARGVPMAIAEWRARGAAGRALVLAGRHSLIVYLVHQPVFIALVALAAMAFAPAASQATTEVATFQSACTRACSPKGAQEALCTSLCACVASRAQEQGLWRPMMESRLTPAQRQALDDLTHACAPGSTTAQPPQ